MTERQRIEEEGLEGGKIKDLPAELPTAPAVSMPTSVEDESPLPRDEQQVTADGSRAIFWIVGSILVTVLFLILVVALAWIF